MSGLIVDGIALVVILLFAVIGTCKGFFKSFLSFFGLFGSLILAILLREQALTLCNSIFGLSDKVTTIVTTKLGEFSPDLINVQKTSLEELALVVQGTDLNSLIKGLFISLMRNTTIVDPVTVAEIIAPKISYGIAIAISVIALFIVVRIIVWILSFVLGKLAKGRVIGKVNRTFGFLFGLVKGVFATLSLMAILSLACMLPSVNDKVTPAIEQSYVSKYAYHWVNDYIVEKIGGVDIGNQEEQGGEEQGGEEQGGEEQGGGEQIENPA